MASDKIVVQPTVLREAASYISDQAANYKQVYEKLYGEIETMSSGWQGEDNQAYTSQIIGFQKNFDNMYKLMNQYLEFLKNAADAYTSTQQELVTQAKKLAN